VHLGTEDNNTTGKFLKQTYEVTEKVIPEGGDLHQAATELATAGIKLIIANLTADRLLALAGYPEMQDAVILDMRTQDDRLRENRLPPQCLPHHAQPRDEGGLRWRQFLSQQAVDALGADRGSNPDDKAFAEAIRRSAKRFAARSSRNAPTPSPPARGAATPASPDPQADDRT
jgi:ABC transporter substrate binding protein (PQQ-dependent alcohol dehydrogenase system)